MVKVIVYSTKECPWCKKTKAFLKEKGIKYTEKDVGSDTKAAHEMIEKSGQQGVPVTDIDGKIVVGFDEDKLKELLNIK
jgi:glutaredoxin-like YruB-family protein|tara:strand:+ start:1533 stop:1769 length:237 start_codon:yes stop_codon:yes gene_type:complete